MQKRRHRHSSVRLESRQKIPFDQARLDSSLALE